MVNLVVHPIIARYIITPHLSIMGFIRAHVPTGYNICVAFFLSHSRYKINVTVYVTFLYYYFIVLLAICSQSHALKPLVGNLENAFGLK